MTKYFSRIALAGLVALIGCSGDSPEPTNPTPPGGTQTTWAVTALTVSVSEPYVGTVVEVTATVTKDGSPAPDGTTVEFTSPPGSTEGAQQVTTSGGQASTGLSSDTEGPVSVRARVNNASRTVSVTFVERAQSDVLHILPPLMPDHGAYEGQEQVLIRGKAIAAPVEVDFIVAGTTFPAVVVSVQESNPIESEGSITIRTPQITNVDSTVSQTATVVVRVGVDTANPQTAQVPAGFTYLAETALWILQPFEPNTGSYEGSETITLRGRGIVAPAEVVFTLGSQNFSCVVQEVVESNPPSADGSIIVATPYIPEDLRPSETHENGYTYFLAAAVDVTVTARANSADAQTMFVPKAFTYLPDETPPPEPDPELWIYQPFDPNFGYYDGGENITLMGRAVEAPVEVVFTLNGQDFQGIVQQVVDSDPLTADGTIVVETPFIPVALRATETIDGRVVVIPAVVDVSVKARAGFQDERTTTVPSAFTFIPPEDPVVLEQWILKEPAFYLVLPDHGATAGGETVTILGRNFRALYIAADEVTVLDTAPAVETVTFGGIEAIVQTVSADGTQVTVMTPRYSTTPIAEDAPVDVEVTTFFDVPANQEPVADLGPFTVSREATYVYLADEPTPVITGIAPISGPVDGGTRVTIFGHGFQVPAQVTFGGQEAIGVEVNDDQTLADLDTIVCVTPDYSQQGAEVPVAVEVIVRNVLSGKVSAASTYTYGDNLYISENTPTEGGPGTNIIIYGSGFEDPLTVDFSCSAGCGQIADLRLEVLSVSGTELLVRVPIDTPVVCAPLSTGFRVTLLESGRVALGGAFTYLGNTPQIFGVDPIFVQETADGDGVQPDDITISGDFFSDDLIVEIQEFRIQNTDIDVQDESTIYVRHIPAPNDFDLDWDYSACVTDAGLVGIRRTPTPVDITVINLPGDCRDTLAGGLVYEPQEDICEVSPLMQVTVPTSAEFGDTAAGDCSAPLSVAIFNEGGGTLEITTLTIQGPFNIDSAPALPFTVDPFTFNTDVMLTFCPVTDNGAEQVGQLIIVSNNPTSPDFYDLAGQEAFPVMVVANSFPLNCAAGTICTGEIFVNNSGTGELNWSSGILGDTELSILATNQPAPPGGSGTITIQLDASGAAALDTFSADVTITAVEGDADGSPATVEVTANVF